MPNEDGKQDAPHIALRWFSLCVAGVVATACLVVFNKALLNQVSHPSASAVLTLFHNATTMLSLWATHWCRADSQGQDVAKVPRRWLLLFQLSGSSSVVLSNLTLQYTDVAFHQVSKLAALPAGAVVDILVYGKRRSAVQYAGLVLIALGVWLGSTGDPLVTVAGVVLASGYCATWLSTSVLVRHVTKLYGVSASQFLMLASPWGVGVSILWIAGTEAFAGSGSAAGSQTSTWSGMQWWLLPAVGMNCGLALLVQYLTTWTQANCTSMVYAVLAQAKTAVTVFLGVLVFNMAMTGTAALGLLICLTVSLLLAGVESPDADLQATLRRLKPRNPKVCIFLAALGASSLCGGFVLLRQPRPPHLALRAQFQGGD